jgi:hypothetical protein
MHDNRGGAAHPTTWALAELNIILFAALCRNPDADLLRATRKYLKERYGQTVPKLLAELLLDSEDIAAAAMNLEGIRATGEGVLTIYQSLLRYGPMRKNWEAKVRPTAKNRRRIFRAKERNTARAREMLRQIQALEDKLPRRAAEEFLLCFRHLAAFAARYERIHKTFLDFWAIKDGLLKPTAADVEDLYWRIRDIAGKGATDEPPAS